MGAEAKGKRQVRQSLIPRSGTHEDPPAEWSDNPRNRVSDGENVWSNWAVMQ